MTGPAFIGPEPGTQAPLADLLDELARYVRRFVVLGAAQADAIALWVAHTYAFAAADMTPYLAVWSPVMRSGKTLLLEVLDLVVRQPLQTMNISDAALFRAVHELEPTLLFDEIDAIFGPKARDREDLRGMLNAGYKRGGSVLRMGGASMRTLEVFSVFCPKAFAGIGELPNTIRDRSIPVRLERRTRKERIERFRRRDVMPGAEDLRAQLLMSLTEERLEVLRAARPQLPDELDDRAQEIWEPLLAIAELAEGGWPDRARTAARELSADGEREAESLRVRLLADIYAVFEATGHDRLRTADLIGHLAAIEEAPWGDWYGKPITAQKLSRHLQPFEIKTLPVWVEGKKERGYKREQFEGAWSRYLPESAEQGGRPVDPLQRNGLTPTALDEPTVLDSGRNAAPGARPTGLPSLEPPEGGRGADDPVPGTPAYAALPDEERARLFDLQQSRQKED